MKPWNDVPEIEPLPDTTWRRIERSVFAELDRDPVRAPAEPRPHWLARWRRPLVGAGMALAAAAVLLVILRSLPGSPQPSRIVTDEAPVALTVGRASLHVAPESALLVHSNHGHEVMIILEQGGVECTVVHDDSQPPLVLQAGDVRVEVVGTSFAVTRQGGSAVVAVREGVVEVFHAGRRTRVGAGQSWAPAGLDPAQGARAQAHGDEGAQAPSISDGETETAEAAGTAVAPRDADEGRGRAEAQARRAETQPRQGGDGARAADPKQRYEHAARLEATEPAAAISIYRELARGKSAWAANALFAQARLELERGRSAVAVRLLETYLLRYPRGNNAADARALLDTAARPTSGR